MYKLNSLYILQKMVDAMEIDIKLTGISMEDNVDQVGCN